MLSNRAFRDSLWLFLIPKRGRLFNVFNNVVFGGIQTNITNANFGRVRSETNTPRVGQIKVRFDF